MENRVCARARVRDTASAMQEKRVARPIGTYVIILLITHITHFHSQEQCDGVHGARLCCGARHAGHMQPRYVYCIMCVSVLCCNARAHLTIDVH